MNLTDILALTRPLGTSNPVGKYQRHSYKLPPQRCALWVPDEKGYVAEFSPKGFRVVESTVLAKHYDEDEVASAAITFWEVTGLRVVVRSVYLQPSAK